MSCWVNVSRRIVSDISETIEILWVCHARHNRIRAQEPSQLGRIESSIEVIDAQASHFSLSGEQAIRIDCTRRKARFPEGIVALFTKDISTRIGHDAI